MKKILSISFLLLITVLYSCKKQDKNGFLSNNLKYTSANQTANIGLVLWSSGAMLTDESTKPMEFSIAAIRKSDGSSAEFLREVKVNTYSWTGIYSDGDTKMEEIDVKRTPVVRPALDINPVNGSLIIYPEVRDPLKFPEGNYVVDILAKNPAGEVVLKNAINIKVVYQLKNPAFWRLGSGGGVDGSVTSLDVKFTRLQPTGGKLIVRYFKKGSDVPINPKEFYGFEYKGQAGFTDGFKDFRTLGAGNPLKMTTLTDRIELDVKYPIPYVAGKLIRIDELNDTSIFGSSMNYWLDFTIVEDGVWQMDIILGND
ncbi:DUF5007 domain-containing protein [Pedobacter caeni]|uniref:DUF5007 domain-containing protein n=1 Tax=Pedobacter caeni TaxID=288992 RepID=A0A1M5H003_9SPHI|nr:DUF5007 domain-containing protein [Pedobacter caeni]SHG09235.1 protein of unknown function [Pedobacter caeni]